MSTGRATRRAARGEVVVERCFLCGQPVTAAERKEAYERVLADQAPPVTDLAHDECAAEAGLWEESEDGEDERPGSR